VAICFTPQDEEMLVCPTGHTPLEDGVDDIDPTVAETATKWDIPLIEIVGAVAAAVTGAVTLRRMRGTSMPFSVPVSLTLLKLPTGALTAFVGLLLMRGGFVPGLTALDSTPQILAWAVIFGAGQQLFTGLVDKQAHNVLDSVGNKTYMPSGGS
jgi:tetrahydromethanopterin S-methyltransferase subunit C